MDRNDTTNGRIFLSTGGFVACVDRVSGQTIWTHVLGGSYVTLLLHADRIYGAAGGGVVCLESASGNLLWKRKLSKLLSPAALTLDAGVPGGQLVAAGGGHLFALRPETGEVLWHNPLPGLGTSEVCLRIPGAVVAQPVPTEDSDGNVTVLEMVDEG